MKILRQYQAEDKATILSCLSKGMDKQLAVQATGLGKTLLASHVINDFNRTLWLTHTEELIDQSAKAILRERMDIEDTLDTHNTILDFLDDRGTAGVFASPMQRAIREDIGIIKQHRMDTHARVQVASVQTIQRRLGKIDPGYYDLVVADEAHLFMAATFQKTLDYFKPKLRLGLTATPERTDGLSLGNIFDEITVQRDIKFGIDNGYLVPLNGIRVRTEINIDGIKTTAGDLNQGDMEKTLNTPARNNLIAESWKKYCAGRPTIGFCVDVRHAIDICEVFNAHGIRADFVVADEKVCPDRFERVRKFKTGGTEVLFNVMILTAGFDFPDVSCVIMARPTKSKTLFLQAIGRETRPLTGIIFGKDTIEERIAAIQASGKPDGIILDIVDSTNQHQLINTYTIDNGKATDDKLFITLKEKQRIKEAVARESKIHHKLEKDEVVNLIALPDSIKVSKSPAMLEPISPAQLAWLKTTPYYTEGMSYTKRDASEIFLKLPATDAQIWRLKKEGFDTTMGNITRGQADAAFLMINAKAKITSKEQILAKLPISDIQ